MTLNRSLYIRLTAAVSACGLAALATSASVTWPDATGEAADSIAPSPRDGHIMASAGAAGGVYLLGGGSTGLLTSRSSIDSLWTWNGTAWRVLGIAPSGARTLSSAAFDSRRGVLVIHGGAEYGSGTRFGDTWEWDGRTWTKHTAPGPGPRDHHAMTYDQARGRVVMYGGFDYQRGTDEQRTTWTWDGRSWSVSDTTGPGGMAHHAMAYDSRRQRVVMFGNVKEPPVERGARWAWSTGPQTWEWDGTRWSRVVAPVEPVVNGPHRMAYDAARGVIMLVAGRDSARETWTYDGATWTRQASIGVGVAPAVAYDQVRQRIVAWGGSAPYIPGRPREQQTPPSQWSRQAWEWDGTRWQQVPVR